MRYLALRHNPTTSLAGMLCLAASLFLAVAAAPASAALPAQLTSQEKINFELAIKSDEELIFSSRSRHRPPEKRA